MNRPINDNIRKNPNKVSHMPYPVRVSTDLDVSLLYNGGFEPYEDPADYLNPRSLRTALKGGRIA